MPTAAVNDGRFGVLQPSLANSTPTDDVASTRTGPTAFDATDQAVDFLAGGYWDVPCAGGPGGEPGSVCATPFPSPAESVARRPLVVEHLTIPIDHAGHFDVVVGTALLPHGLLSKTVFTIRSIVPAGTHTDRYGVRLRIVSTDPTAPAFENGYARGARPGSETVEVHIVFDIVSVEPGASLEIEGLLVR